jgi:diaminobutyrate-2-oxoglutarate transaminase
MKGRGMFQGINCVSGEIASKITKKAFKKGMIIETSGADDQIVKLFCPLTITQENLEKGISILRESIKEVCSKEDEIPEEKVYFQTN